MVSFFYATLPQPMKVRLQEHIEEECKPDLLESSNFKALTINITSAEGNGACTSYNNCVSPGKQTLLHYKNNWTKIKQNSLDSKQSSETISVFRPRLCPSDLPGDQQHTRFKRCKVDHVC